MLSVAQAVRSLPLLAFTVLLAIASPQAGVDTAAQKLVEPVIIISRSDCRELTDHYLVGGISAMFDDDEARWVAENVPSAQSVRLAMLEELAIDLTSELQRRLGLSADSILLRPESVVGNVVVKGDGIAVVNGQRLSDTESYAIAALCRSPG